jgi:ATP-binding cassette, subfamily B, bacterial PglK
MTADPPSSTPASVRSSLGFLWRSMAPRRRRHFYAVIAVMLLGTLAELLTIGAVLPFLALVANAETAGRLPLFRDLAGLVDATTPDELLFAAAMLLIFAAVTAVTVRLWLTRVTLAFVLVLGHEIATKVFARMLRQPYGFYVTRNSSELLASQEKVQAVIWSVLMPGMQAVTAGVIAIAILTMLFLIDPFTATMAAVTLATCYLLVSFVVRRKLQRNSNLLAWAATQRIQTMQEGLGGIRDVLLEQSQDVFETKFKKVDYQYRLAQVINNFISLAPRYLVEGAGIVMLALLTLYLAGRAGGVVAAIPVLGALAVGAQRLLPLLQQAYNGWSSFAGNRQMLADVVELMQAPIVTSTPRDRATAPVPFKRDIALDRVSFHYESRAAALSNVSLTIAKGERVGLVGETGSGKSTLLDVLMGLLDPTSGAVLIDGQPLADSNRANWQAQIAHVPQAIYLSDSSIASNIAFGEPEDAIDMDRVRDAAGRAHIADFIAGLPQDFETSVGERGVRLSGGQRQRIGIARALYKRATVLVFDEATSALDGKVEAAIMQSIFDLERQLTLVMIAHRTTTLIGCDRIVRLAAGEIVETGSYDAVLGGEVRARRPRRRG